MSTILAFVLYCTFVGCSGIWVWQGYRRVKRFMFGPLTVIMAICYFFAYILAVAFSDISEGKETLSFGLFCIGLAMCGIALFGGAIFFKRYPQLRTHSVPTVVGLNILAIMWSFAFIA